jgi:hypothetical protein
MALIWYCYINLIIVALPFTFLFSLFISLRSYDAVIEGALFYAVITRCRYALLRAGLYFHSHFRIALSLLRAGPPALPACPVTKCPIDAAYQAAHYQMWISLIGQLSARLLPKGYSHNALDLNFPRIFSQYQAIPLNYCHIYHVMLHDYNNISRSTIARCLLRTNTSLPLSLEFIMQKHIMLVYFKTRLAVLW